MTKEQVLGIAGLTADEKARVEAAFLAAERTKGTCVLTTLNTEAEVKTAIATLMANYAKRLEAKAKKAENKKAATDELNSVVELLKEAKTYGFTVADVTAAVKALIKDKKNAEINAQIAALQAQLIK